MATTPKIYTRDGTTLTTSLVFTTNLEFATITGVVDTNVASVQVSVNGADFVADPTLVSLSLQNFTIPNLSVYSSGLSLDVGVNTILVRAVDLSGGVSTPATILITRTVETEVPGSEIPTGIQVQRNRNYVNILVAKPKPLVNTIVDDTGTPVVVVTQPAKFLGFNIYASSESAGTSGYYKINKAPITAPSTFQESATIITIDDLAVWDASTAKYVRVRISEEDEFGNETVVRLNTLHDNSTLAGKLEYKAALRNFTLDEYLVYKHDRNSSDSLNGDQFLAVSTADPLYYVVTGLYYDDANNVEVETPYSQEIQGTPLVLDTTIRDLPERSRAAIAISFMDQVVALNSKISMIPGSVTRDVDVDPFSSEAERLWFILDFIHRSQSFLTLLAIDNVSGSGVSDPVPTSAYKRALKSALGSKRDSSIQGLIDQQFDKLAANANKYRFGGRSATGALTLYTNIRPTRDIQIPAGSLASSSGDSANGIAPQRYRIGGSYIMVAANADSYYNFDARRYEIRVSAVADKAGSSGNVPPNSVLSIIGVSGLSVVNETALVGGSDLETNADLAARAILGYASVDTGTEYGYASKAAAKIGVSRSKIVKSGDRLMMRDYDDVRKKHIGGKVDIWVQGVQERQVQDRFAFTFDVATDIQCQVLDAINLIFRVLDSRVTPATPIVEILNNSASGFGVRNATLGQDYDLSGVNIIDYDKFQISTSVPQPATALEDIIFADYRFQAVNQLFMTIQPVRRIVSVVGEVSGPLTSGVHYNFYKTDDPLLEGESFLAKNYIAIVPSGGIPSGDTIQLNDELHVMVGFEPEPLGSIGVNTATIKVYSEDRLTMYNGPSTLAPDFDIIAGTATTPAKIVRTFSSNIANGQEVSVDYAHDENFTVTYVVNETLQQLQTLINSNRHVTADVLVKQAIGNEIEVETTAQLKPGASKEKSDPSIRNNTSLTLFKKNIGEGTAQSNIDAAINDSQGVDFNVLPMAKMAYADGSLRLREALLSTNVRLTSLDQGGNSVYLLTQTLNYPTTDGGGTAYEHKGVFKDDEAMSLVSNLSSVGLAANQAFIIGDSGAIIAGYSDDATLASEGYLSNEYAEQRLIRTANHVVISISGSTIPAETPVDHEYHVSYVVRGDKGPHDIEVSEVEYLVPGAFTITYSLGD